MLLTDHTVLTPHTDLIAVTVHTDLVPMEVMHPILQVSTAAMLPEAMYLIPVLPLAFPVVAEVMEQELEPLQVLMEIHQRIHPQIHTTLNCLRCRHLKVLRR